MSPRDLRRELRTKVEFKMPNSFNALTTFKVDDLSFRMYKLGALKAAGLDVSRLPFSLKILLENLLRNEDGTTVTADDITAAGELGPQGDSSREIAFRPSRVLLQDFTGVPAVVDLAAMRDAMKRMGGIPRRSTRFSRWSSSSTTRSRSMRPAPACVPDQRRAGIPAEPRAVRASSAGGRTGSRTSASFPPTPGSSTRSTSSTSHASSSAPTTSTPSSRPARADLSRYPGRYRLAHHDDQRPGCARLGRGGIEAEAAMLGQPVSMLVPQVIGFKLTGTLPEGATATDLVLTVTEMLRRKGVVGKFVEYYGAGLANLPLADRATIANMAPEYGATCGIFPVDAETLRYLELSGRPAPLIRLVETYCREQGLLPRAGTPEAVYSDTLELDLSTVEPSLAGPKRPQDRVPLKGSKDAWQTALNQMLESRPAEAKAATPASAVDAKSEARLEGEGAARRSASRTRRPPRPVAARSARVSSPTVRS